MVGFSNLPVLDHIAEWRGPVKVPFGIIRHLRFFPFYGGLVFLTLDMAAGAKIVDACFLSVADHEGLEINWSLQYPVYKMQTENGIVFLRDVKSISSDRAEERITPPKDKKKRIRYYPRSGIMIKWERMEEQ